MRVLWFAITPAGFAQSGIPAGGWIESLERIVKTWGDCELGVAFEYGSDHAPEKKDGVMYYPIHPKRTRFQEKYIDSYTSRYTDEQILKRGQEIIADFKPDIIHVFGSEWCYGMLAKYTKVPIVIHMQGFWAAYRNVNLSQTATRTLWDVMHETWKPQLWLNFLRHKHRDEERAKREEEILSMNRYYMGRTRWDMALTRLYAPKSEYFYCSEALRGAFIDAQGEGWSSSIESERTVASPLCRLVTVGNWDMIKGYDLVLQTAKLLKERAPFDFEWRLVGAGADAIEILRRKLKINAEDVNVKLMGTRPAAEVVNMLRGADIFMQTSWIDNSPNAVCEAQYLGLPIITTNVGGVPSLFADDYDRDLMVPLHDPYYLASKVIELYQDKPRMQRLAKMNYDISHARHDDDAISRDLRRCYEEIIKNSTLAFS